MLTNIYWVTALTIIFAVFYLIAVRFSMPKLAFIVVALLGITSHSFYYFYLEQLLVKHYGGSMVIQIPDGQHHLGVTWKDEHLWIENYDPIKNECIFREYSRGSVLEGQVKLRNCNPLLLQDRFINTPPLPSSSEAAE
ncbi:MAG: hypothetical protein GX029_11745 [Pseudomonadaceae bacterium]|nr:hypothetical protein [Pseudomonadaceae bacterium]